MKRLFVFLMIVFCSAAVFAQVSIGGGGLVSGSFSSWFLDKDKPGDLDRFNSSLLGVAPFVFVDLKYAEISIALPIGTLKGDSTMSTNPNFPASTLGLRGSAYFKIPFALSSRFSLFPMIGADFDLFFSAKKDDDRDALFPVSGTSNVKAGEALNTLWFKAGIGLDTFITEHLFIRTEALYGIRLNNKMEKYFRDIRSGEMKSMLTHGGDFKLAIGYRF